MPGQEIQEPARRGRRTRHFDASAPLPPQPVAIAKKQLRAPTCFDYISGSKPTLLIERVVLHYPLGLCRGSSTVRSVKSTSTAGSSDRSKA